MFRREPELLEGLLKKMRFLKSHGMLPLVHDERLFAFLRLKTLEKRRQKFLTEEEEDLSKLPSFDYYHLDLLLNDNGVFAFCLGLITAEQAIHMKPSHLQALLSNPTGIVALHKKWLTPEQANEMEFWRLKALLDPETGFRALEERLITPEKAIELPYALFIRLFIPKGILALREGLITPEQVSKFTFQGNLSSLLTEEGLKALREKTVTPEDGVKLLPPQLKALLTKEPEANKENKKPGNR